MSDPISNLAGIDVSQIDEGLKPIFKNIGIQFDPEEDKTEPPKITDISDIFAPAVNQATSENQNPEVIEAKKEAEDYKKRYGDSTAENQRLLDEMKTYAPYKPLLEKLVADGTVPKQIQDLISSKGAPKTILETLKLPEDFKFVSEDAMTNPESDSAKLQYAIIGDAVERRFTQLAGKQNKSIAIDREKDNIRKEIGDDDVYKKFMSFLGGFKPNLNDFLKLFTMNERDALVATEAGKRVLAQIQKANQLGEGSINGLGDLDTDINKELKFYQNYFGLGDFTESSELSVT